MTQLTTTPTEPKSDFLSRPLLTTLNLDWEKAIYIAFILMAIVTRFWNLGDRVMSHDESLHTQFSYQFYNGDGYSHTPLMHGPFLFHITAVSYWLFGDSDLSARIPVAIFGVILVMMPYLLRRWLGRVGAIFTSFLFLISPYVTYYSRYIRHDVYVVVWAMIVFIATWYYFQKREEKYLWWFAAGTALMFATKEVAFIYVAIFGSFLLLRLLYQMGTAEWMHHTLPKLRPSIMVVLIGVLLIGGGFIGQRTVSETTAAEATTEATEGFAADPNQELPTDTQIPTSSTETILRWIQLAGIGVLSAGLFLAAREMRPHIDKYPEFDLIVLFTTLVLPMVSPLLTTIAGWNPRDYTITSCKLEGEETMTALQLLLTKMGNSICWSSILESGVVRSGFFLILMLIVAVLVGMWWHRRRWLITAVIFHTIFAILYTSVFTNPGGWTSGMVGSLGYWLEQQAVQRGSQPTFYYFFVTPFYEFLPLIFALAAGRLWLQKHKLNKIIGYWLTLIIGSYFIFSFSNWLFNRPARLAGAETNIVLGVIPAALVLAAGLLYWFFVRYKQLLAQYELRRNLRGLVDPALFFEFVPLLIWWLLLTVVAYSYAGEKMPWLSIHFVIPMALLSGWYFNEKLTGLNASSLFSQSALRLLGLTMVLIVAVLLALAPLLLGQIQFGNQALDNLSGIGRFLGSLLVAGGVFYVWQYLYPKVDEPVRKPILILSVFGLLTLLTIRFTYMANIPNANYTTEFMVYAHGAPATKNIIMQQVEQLSMRMYGDKSIKVAFSQDTSWPFTWYLREYPNRVYFGDNPSNSLAESPIVLVGSVDWAKVEPYLGDNYEQRTYTYLWWPMEEYRKISWDAIVGNSNLGTERRGLGNAKVRQALWDIFFYRDYQKYGEVFGGTYTAGEWPLRHELRLYIRRDVLSNLWDYGIGAVNAAGLQDPYAENDLQLSPVMVLNEFGGSSTAEGEFLAPRNVAVGPDGRIYVADTGNHRIQVFDENGQFLYAWGSFGSEPGSFNEPWGLAVDENYIYVADTWNHRLQKFTLAGEMAGVFGRSGSPGDNPEDNLGLFFGPRDIVLLNDNQLLVTDTGNHRMQVLSRDGQFISQIGGFGNQLGQFNEPVGLGRSLDGSVFLADTWNGRIQQFTSGLFAINEWKVNAWSGQSINNKPYLAVDSGGRVYVTDPEGYRILIFSPLGDYLGRFGSFGTDPGSFGLPNGIAIDAEDNIYIADATNNRVLKFAPIFGVPQAAPIDEVDELMDEADIDAEEVDTSPDEEQPAEDANGDEAAPESNNLEESGEGGNPGDTSETKP